MTDDQPIEAPAPAPSPTPAPAPAATQQRLKLKDLQHVREFTLTGAGDDEDRVKLEDFVRQLIRVHEPFRVLKDWDMLGFDLPELAPPGGDAGVNRDLGTAIADKVRGIAEHMLRRIQMDDGRGMFLLLVRQFAQLRGHGAPQRAELERLNINQFNSALDYVTKFERLTDAFKRATNETLPTGMLRLAFMGALDPARGAASRWTPSRRHTTSASCRRGCPPARQPRWSTVTT